MTHETHNIEFKQSWRDEYLKWVCGFANADGGIVYIGKDDEGNTVGVEDAKRLLEDIPNKIQMHLGIVCDVRRHDDGVGEYIEISVDPSPYPVNYKGEFHYRSGATKQILRGNALTRFIFDRTGLSWESVVVGSVDQDDLWRESFSIFRGKALESGRMTGRSWLVRTGNSSTSWASCRRASSTARACCCLAIIQRGGSRAATRV